MLLLNTPRFPLGRIVVTANAQERLCPPDILTALQRHGKGDWGECCSEDAAENEQSLKEGFRLFSIYQDRNDLRFWIITEAGRSSTTILLPEDY